MANWSDVVDLVSWQEGQDEAGFPIKEKVIRAGIFANKKSIRSSDYYMAKQSGIQLSMLLEVRSIEYQGEEELIYNNENYVVERTYDRGEFVELTCKKESDDHGT